MAEGGKDGEGRGDKKWKQMRPRHTCDGGRAIREAKRRKAVERGWFVGKVERQGEGGKQGKRAPKVLREDNWIWKSQDENFIQNSYIVERHERIKVETNIESMKQGACEESSVVEGFGCTRSGS